tara:strand:+ start:9376 stop:9957 length:582 start_codon:yes stop_codon:yes gene_type:complete
MSGIIQATNLQVDNIKSSGGTTGMTIGSDGVISQPTLPIFHVTKSADQSSIANGTDTLITFDEVTDGSNGGRTINQGGLWASNKLTVTASTTGYYWIYTNLFWQSTAAINGNNYGYWKKNGSTKLDIVFSNTQGNSETTGVINAKQVVDLTTSGDYVEFYINFSMQGGGSPTVTINQDSLTSQRTTVGGWKIA